MLWRPSRRRSGPGIRFVAEMAAAATAVGDRGAALGGPGTCGGAGLPISLEPVPTTAVQTLALQPERPDRGYQHPGSNMRQQIITT